MMMRIRRSACLLALPALLAGAASPRPLQAQGGPNARGGSLAQADPDEAMRLSRSLPRGGYAVVIDLDENRLSFRQGRTVLWSAPIGTGTGLRLETGRQEWDFSTPNGVFHVQYKEENPVWIAPDWYFIENGLPVPPANHEDRYFPGGLGAAAVYIGHDLAIHGTDKPELLGQRVSHGCIRLDNRYAIRLFHNVQVGTEVIIVGGENAPPPPPPVRRRGSDASTSPPRRPPPPDPMLERWKGMRTGELVGALTEELWMPVETTRWPEVAGLLIDRALDDRDEDALEGLMRALGDLPNRRLEREYATFLADAYSRGSLRTLAVLSQLDRRDRERVAEAIVTAMMGLYPGELDAAPAPWPTRRVPESAVGWDGRRGWQALREAEQEFRDGASRAI